MTKTSVRMLVALAVVLTFVAVCHSSAWAPAKAVAPWLADSNDPNAPPPGPEMVPLMWLYEEPNEPNEPPPERA